MGSDFSRRFPVDPRASVLVQHANEGETKAPSAGLKSSRSSVSCPAALVLFLPASAAACGDGALLVPAGSPRPAAMAVLFNRVQYWTAICFESD
jgi:hypothetical protein